MNEHKKIEQQRAIQQLVTEWFENQVQVEEQLQAKINDKIAWIEYVDRTISTIGQVRFLTELTGHTIDRILSLNRLIGEQQKMIAKTTNQPEQLRQQQESMLAMLADLRLAILQTKQIDDIEVYQLSHKDIAARINTIIDNNNVTKDNGKLVRPSTSTADQAKG